MGITGYYREVHENEDGGRRGGNRARSEGIFRGGGAAFEEVLPPAFRRPFLTLSFSLVVARRLFWSSAACTFCDLISIFYMVAMIIIARNPFVSFILKHLAIPNESIKPWLVVETKLRVPY